LRPFVKCPKCWRRAKVDFGDEDHSDIREVRIGHTVVHGISQFGTGIVLLIAGLVLVDLALLRQVLPKLGI
jgi:hypothetical protein